MNPWSQTYTEDQIDQIAGTILQGLEASDQHATVLALQGDLGAGKTTLTKALAKQLGIQETVISPTFVIAKFYEPAHTFERLAHLDAYRIEDTNELVPLGWEQLVQQPKTLVIVEWPERIADALPDHVQTFAISHEDDKRTIKKI